jgi:hypothetical protein
VVTTAGSDEPHKEGAMIIDSESFDRKLKLEEILVYTAFSQGFKQTLGIWWNIVETDLDEYFEYTIDFKSQPFFSLTSEGLREGTSLWAPESLDEINEFFEWLSSQPDKYYEVRLILDDHYPDPDDYYWFTS